MYGRTVEKCPAAASRGKKLARKGVIDGAEAELSAFGKREGDRAVAQAAYEIGRAVNGIKYPEGEGGVYPGIVLLLAHELHLRREL